MEQKGTAYTACINTANLIDSCTIGYHCITIHTNTNVLNSPSCKRSHVSFYIVVTFLPSLFRDLNRQRRLRWREM